MDAVVLHRRCGLLGAERSDGASRSGTSSSSAAWVGFTGLMNVRMFVTPSAPKISARLGDASQRSASSMSWWAMIVGKAFSYF